MRTILDDDSADTADIMFRDPDQRAAWEELETYMRTDEGTKSRPAGPDFGMPESGGMPTSLRKDFRNLEVAPGASMTEVRASYKRLLAAFHPDRHANDPEKLRTATEVTKKLNQSYYRIRTYYEGGTHA